MGMVDEDYVEVFSDQPWVAAEGSALLQRGDVVCVFSDGIGDNLMNDTFIKVLTDACESSAVFIREQ